MSTITLKNLFKKNPLISDVLSSYLTQTDKTLAVYDHQNHLLYGAEQANTNSFRLDLVFDQESKGYIVGTEQSCRFTESLIQLSYNQEKQKKDIGSEVLGLYREINLIYGFSEQLCECTELDAIAQLAMKEVNRLIKVSGGLVFIWDENSLSYRVLTTLNDQSIIGEQNYHEFSALKESPAEIHSLDSLRGYLTTLQTTLSTALFAPLKVKNNSLGGILLWDNRPEPFNAADMKFLTTIALQSASAMESSVLYHKRIQEAVEREETMRRIHETTYRFVPVEFIQLLGRQSLMEVRLGDQVLKDVTVMFVDIRSYTTLSEKMTPEENFKFVNAFNRRIGPIIKLHHGFINQYLGDGIMAVFTRFNEDAVMAAIDIQREIRIYNQSRQAQGRIPIRLGIGIHSGPLVLGITGDEERLDAATISDTVNTASRIESLTKYYKAGIILSQQTVQGIQMDQEAFRLRPLGKVQVKGKDEPVSIFECYSGDDAIAIELKDKTIPLFKAGLEAYLLCDFTQARAFFNQLLTRYPADETAQWFVDRINYFTSGRADHGWTGVEKMLAK